MEQISNKACVGNRKVKKYIFQAYNISSIRILFVLAYVVAAAAANDVPGIKDNKKYFLSKGDIKNYSVMIDNDFWKKLWWSTN